MRLILLVLLGLAGLTLAWAVDEPAGTATAASGYVLVDSTGKEVKLSNPTFTEGVRRLGWLAKPEQSPPGKDKPPSSPKTKGKRPTASAFDPVAIVIRDAAKFTFAEGVVALVPLKQVRSVSFDPEKRTMTLRAATSDQPADDVTFTGTTLYKGNNKLTLEAEVNKGALGVAAVTYQGGIPKGGFRELRFPTPQVESPKPGRAAVVLSADKTVKREDKVIDLQPLYRLADGREVLVPTLLFKKTLRLDVSKIAGLAQTDAEGDDIVWKVTATDNETADLTLLTTGRIHDQDASLIGLVGRTAYGYRLFPPRRIVSVWFDATEVPKGTLLPAPKELPDEGSE
ncbi:MAG: hypothetical protein SNJ82_00390 [Gemmataceae bacterium]